MAPKIRIIPNRKKEREELKNENDNFDDLVDSFQMLFRESDSKTREEEALPEKNKESEEGIECMYCHSGDVILEKGSYTCQNCQAIVCQYLDVSAEWRNFMNDDSKGSDMTRCGMPINDLLPISSLSSVMGYSDKRESKDVRILRKYHMWGSMPYKERKLYNIFDTLTVNAMTHEIPKNIIEQAKVYYKQFSEIKSGRGYNRQALIASSLFVACKKNNVPRSAKEIAKVFNIKNTYMTKGCKIFQEIMGMSTCSTSASDFIPRFCSPLNLDQRFQTICKQVIRQIDQHDIACDNTPPSIAVSVICFCAGILNKGIDKKQISENCDISQITINKCCRKIEDVKDMIINNTQLKLYV